MLWSKASPLDLDFGLCARAKLFNMIRNVIQAGLSRATLEIDSWSSFFTSFPFYSLLSFLFLLSYFPSFLAFPRYTVGRVAGRSSQKIMPSLAFPTGLSSRPSVAISHEKKRKFAKPHWGCTPFRKKKRTISCSFFEDFPYLFSDWFPLWISANIEEYLGLDELIRNKYKKNVIKKFNF